MKKHVLIGKHKFLLKKDLNLAALKHRHIRRSGRGIPPHKKFTDKDFADRDVGEQKFRALSLGSGLKSSHHKRFKPLKFKL